MAAGTSGGAGGRTAGTSIAPGCDITYEMLLAKVAVGGFVVIDDYGAVPGCRIATDEFRAAHGVDDPLEPIDWTGVYWRRTR